ncbi:MAG: HD domain-containing protein [Desulfovibrionaceae bacterium]|jgi:HD-GYP domain-containing protein (c-di-GMP phosphodiesterase class II)|nr:HD domain-containing protein [Desulfovibrionaceae bacterium]
MIRLKKLLKPRFLQPHLETALPLLGPGAYVAVCAPDRILAAAGTPSAELDPAALPAVPGDGHLCRELAVEGAHLGHLVVGPSADAAPGSLDASRAAAVLAMLGSGLDEIVLREFGRRCLGEETLEQYRELALLQRATVNLNSSIKLMDVVHSFLAECEQSALPTDCGAVFLHGGGNGRGRHKCLATYGPLSREDFLRVAGGDLYDSVVRTRSQGEIVNNLEEDERWNAELPALAQLMVVPLLSSGTPLGALVLGSSHPGPGFKAAHLKRTETLASAAATALANAQHFEQVQQMLTALVQSMATAIDSRDSLTAGHSHRVARYAMGLARAVNSANGALSALYFSEAELREIFFAGLLHDVGKIGVREEVLTKGSRLPERYLELVGLRLSMWSEMHQTDWEPLMDRLTRLNTAYDLSEEDVAFIHELAQKRVRVGERVVPVLMEEERDRMLTPRGNLTPEEWLEIKRHPTESHRILKSIPFTSHFPNLLEAVLQHHERLDGSGYPNGIMGEDVILQARLLAIVDIYDSLRRDRHYKKALPQNMALNILREEVRLGKLDHRFVQVFIDNISAIETTLSQTGLPTTLPLDHTL